MSYTCAIIPVREFGAAKLRLQSVLSADRRKSLSIALLSRVLSTIERSDVEKMIVVASDKNEISESVPAFSKLTVISEKVHHSGVTSAINDAIDFLGIRNLSKTVIFPSDLPMINHQRVSEALMLLDKYEVVINPSFKKNGTNLLALTRLDGFVFHYDDDSYRRHLEEAKSLKLRLIDLDWDEFSFDIDDADDLEMLINIYKTTSFEDLVLKISKADN